jgi:hypothetical protein
MPPRRNVETKATPEPPTKGSDTHASSRFVSVAVAAAGEFLSKAVSRRRHPRRLLQSNDADRCRQIRKRDLTMLCGDLPSVLSPLKFWSGDTGERHA